MTRYFFDTARQKRQAANPTPIFFDNLNITDAQRMICENNIECMFDLAVTGLEEIGLNTLNQQKQINATIDLLSKF